MENKKIPTWKKRRDHAVKEMDYNKSDTCIDDSQVLLEKMVNMYNWIFVRITDRCMFDSSCLVKSYCNFRISGAGLSPNRWRKQRQTLGTNCRPRKKQMLHSSTP
jgi:hypothetical protein